MTSFEQPRGGCSLQFVCMSLENTCDNSQQSHAGVCQCLRFFFLPPPPFFFFLPPAACPCGATDEVPCIQGRRGQRPCAAGKTKRSIHVCCGLTARAAAAAAAMLAGRAAFQVASRWAGPTKPPPKMRFKSDENGRVGPLSLRPFLCHHSSEASAPATTARGAAPALALRSPGGAICDGGVLELLGRDRLASTSRAHAIYTFVF